jgi:hypothetical protein
MPWASALNKLQSCVALSDMLELLDAAEAISFNLVQLLVHVV